jgi:predicted signal transduction protein with EAL and GGDEF domain
MMLRYARTLDVRPQLPASPSAALVLFGDLLGLLLFVSWGLYAHNLLAWEVPGHTAETLAPFLAAWLVLAPLFCLYHRRTLRSYRRTVTLLVPGWVAIALVAATIRATQFFDGGAGVTFVLVNVAFGLLILTPWRLGVVTVLRRVFPSDDR